MFRLPDNASIGEYTIARFIKKGLLNDSYVIRDENGVPFFMKAFDLGRIPDKMLVEGVVEEIWQCRRISHPNIIKYTADGVLSVSGQKYPCLVTQFFNGALLSEALRGGRTFSVAEAKAILIPIAEGLVYLHDELQVNHNDLTPRNILLETAEDGTVTPKIIDLGHMHADLESAPPFPVDDLNVQYLAPEALKGTFTSKGDVFSAAAILYTMLYGMPPWDCGVTEKTPYYSKKITVQHAREVPLIFPNTKQVDPEIIDLLERGLRFNPDERPDAAAFLELLSAGCAPTPPELAHNQKARRQPGNPVIPPPDPQEPPKDPGEQTDKPREDAVSLQARRGKPGDGGFADVAGMEGLKRELLNRVIWVLRDKEKAAKYRLTPPNGMLLYGPPGCGKTFFAKKFAEESGFNYYLVNGSDLGSTYIHGTQGKIADLFRKAAENAPSVICFDEFDAFVPARGSDSARHRADEINEFLSQLNNCAERGIFVIGTTNRMDMIDSAVLRKGRMDLKYEIPAPDAETRRAMFELYLKGRPLDGELNLGRLTTLTEGYASADIAFIVNESAMVAALADQPITQQILEESIQANPSSLTIQKRVKIGFDTF